MVKISSKIIILIALLLLGCGSGTSSSTTAPNVDIYTKTLYNNDFEPNSPLMYSVVFGSPRVVGPIGQMQTSSLEFNSTGNLAPFYYDQIIYGVDQQGSPYAGLGSAPFHISFDVMTNGLKGSDNHFTVIFDTPTVRNIDFLGDGTIRPSKVSAAYEDNVKSHVDVYFDISSNLWKIYIDGKEIYSDVINGESLRSIRFNHGATTADNIDFSATTYVDNILISTVP